MNFNKIQKLAAKAEDANEQLDRVTTLFNYPSVDEQTAAERVHDDTQRYACITVGGPSVHARVYALTRAEMNLLEPVLRRILEARHILAKSEMLKEVGDT